VMVLLTGSLVIWTPRKAFTSSSSCYKKFLERSAMRLSMTLESLANKRQPSTKTTKIQSFGRNKCLYVFDCVKPWCNSPLVRCLNQLWTDCLQPYRFLFNFMSCWMSLNLGFSCWVSLPSCMHQP